MGIFFSGQELLEIAIGMERNGIAFYDVLAKSTENAEVRAVYDYLAGEERKHVLVFQDMLRSLGQECEPPEVCTEEYAAYLKALLDSKVFSDEAMAREEARKVSSDTEALEIAMTVEKDSILFYSEMRGLIRRRDREVVGKVIAEERSHLMQFSALREKLVSGRK